MQTCYFSNAYEFLKELDSIPFSWPEGSGQWFFRGQASSEWGLTPTLFRDDLVDLLPSLESKQSFEKDLLAALKRDLKRRSMVPQRFLDDDLNLLALARHYGAPTRVLDWSRSPLVAAYFASEPLMPKKQTEKLSVFAVAEVVDTVTAPGHKVEIVFPSEAANPNLQAQRGVLFVHDWKTQDLWRRDLEGRRAPGELRVTSEGFSRFIRLDLARSEVHVLREMLRKLGVDGVSMFPGNAGFVQLAMSEAWNLAMQPLSGA